MDILTAKSSVAELVSEIAKRAESNGLAASYRTGLEKADCTPCEADDKKLAYIFGEAMISASSEDGADGLAFEIYVYCKDGEADEESLESELTSVRAAAEEFFAGLAGAEDKSEYARSIIEKERKVAEELRAEIERSAEKAKRVGIISAAVGVGILLLAAVLIILI